jgi:hypothetical protein
MHPVGGGWVSLGPGWAQPAGDESGAGEAGLGEQGLDLVEFGLAQAVGETR